VSELDKLCEELWESELIKRIARAIKYGRLTLTFHKEKLTEVEPAPRKRQNDS